MRRAISCLESRQHAGRHVLREVGSADHPCRDRQHVRPLLQGPGQPDLRDGHTVRAGDGTYPLALTGCRTRLAPGTGDREERDEGEAEFTAEP